MELHDQASATLNRSIYCSGCPYLLPRLLIPSSFGLPPVVNCRGTRPSQAARSRPWSKLSAWPTAATSADATIAPKPGIVDSRDPAIEFGPLRASVGDEQDHAWAQPFSALLVHEDGQELLELPLALRRDHSALQQDGAQLIDQSRSL